MVDTEQAQEMADAHCMGHIETSAKDNIGVTEVRCHKHVSHALTAAGVYRDGQVDDKQEATE